MSVLNKLLNMLDKLKEENPELANKALLAAETLKSGVDPEELEGEYEDEEWEEEEEEEEEQYDDSYVEITAEDTQHFFALRDLLNTKVSEFGVYTRDHEVKKTILLEEIETLREDNEKIILILREKYRLDPESEYSIEINQNESGNIVFVKQ